MSYHVTSHIYVSRQATDLSDILKFEEREKKNLNQHTAHSKIYHCSGEQKKKAEGEKENQQKAKI